MAKIKILSPLEIRKIAAGEVIERPANVIKELIENALDAGASTITLFIEHGGKTLIRIIDDGGGMSPEDARLSIVHHATSKITHLEDLDSLSTFGFRGEALSSIASVSHFGIKTREPEAMEGTQLIIEEGRIVQESLCACPVGTDITVADLFYNIPARKKFLKTDETELRTIVHLVQAFALCYPERAFKMYHNQKLILHCQPTQTLEARLPMLYEEPFVKAIIPCIQEVTPEGVTFTGAISNPHYIRYDRNQMYFFVNKRWIKSPKLTHAFIKGYDGVLPVGRYPAGSIFITLDPAQVDINVHPRKEEVQFLHPRRLETALEELIRSTLALHTSKTIGQKSSFAHISLQVPALEPATPLPPIKSIEPAFSTRLDALNQHATLKNEAVYQETTQASIEAFKTALDTALPSTTPQEEQTYTHKATEAQNSYRILGQFKTTYIILENEEGLVLIDQHAAHERVLYELFAKRFSEVSIVPLLFPPLLSFASDEASILAQYVPLLAEYGIELYECGNNQYMAKTLPVMLKNVDINHFIRSFIASHNEIEEKELGAFTQSLHHALRAQMACKAAVKAGDILTQEHMLELIKTLSTVEHRFTCPHGRPTSWNISLSEIERKFKRKL